ncbi:hypothetical protein [Loktanella atrilutea]|uniref:hypothetical protein n=1 Tax=Loktanella atrilutea TaxID=366533 RepID=UPI000932881B|nr:hypothetical protein [Loktanella atrilutea]
MWKFVATFSILASASGAQSRIERCDVYGQIADELAIDLAELTKIMMAHNTVMQLLARMRPEEPFKVTAKLSQDSFDESLTKLVELGAGVNDGIQTLVLECTANQ